MSQKEKELLKNEMDAKLLLENFLALAKLGDYLIIQAYLPEEVEICHQLDELQFTFEKSLKVPVSVQFGPRYLHSTGQYHKGGPNNGFFIQFVYDASCNLPIPGQAYSFDVLLKAQAIGDMQALIHHKRNVLLVDLGKNVIKGLSTFASVAHRIQPVGRIGKAKLNLVKRKEPRELELAMSGNHN